MAFAVGMRRLMDQYRQTLTVIDRSWHHEQLFEIIASTTSCFLAMNVVQPELGIEDELQNHPTRIENR